MRILVTGASGYLGRGIVNELLNRKHEIIASDLSSDFIDERATYIAGNIFDIKDPYSYFQQPEAVLHLAWRNGFVHDADNHLQDLPLHDSFIKKMMDAGIEKVCVMGSMHEIGFYEGSINENTPCNPMNQYGIAKNALRQSLELYANVKKVKFIWLRGFYIVGNSINGSSIFSKIALAIKEGNLEFPFTSGQNQYDYLDYSEFCRQVGAAISQDRILGVINICSGKPEKLCDRVEQFIRDNDYNIKLVYGAYPDRPYDSKAVWGNDKKIRRILEESIN